MGARQLLCWLQRLPALACALARLRLFPVSQSVCAPPFSTFVSSSLLISKSRCVFSREQERRQRSLQSGRPPAPSLLPWWSPFTGGLGENSSCSSGTKAFFCSHVARATKCAVHRSRRR